MKRTALFAVPLLAALFAVPAVASVCAPCQRTWLLCRECDSFASEKEKTCVTVSSCDCRQTTTDCSGSGGGDCSPNCTPKDETFLDDMFFDAEAQVWRVAAVGSPASTEHSSEEGLLTTPSCQEPLPYVIY